MESRARLADTALTRRWVVAYFAFNFLLLGVALWAPLGVLFGASMFGGPQADPGVIVQLATGALVFDGLIATLTTVLVAWRVQSEVAAALTHLDAASGEDWIVAPAYLQSRGRTLRRPAGALCVSRNRVTFLAAKQRDRELDFDWPLAELETAESTRDRFGFVSRILDLQGGLALSHAGQPVTLSVVDCRRFLERLGERWGAAQAAARVG